MELRVLRYFLMVAREENITKAAEILHITQPTLSRQLMQLEEELGTQLFVRGKNRIQLTEDGMLLRRRAEDIVDLADKTEKEFLQREETISGDIYLGAGETYHIHLLAGVMKHFHELYPQVKYHMHSGNADDIKEQIDKGLIDIGLLTEPVQIEKYDFIRLPGKEVWGVLIRKDHPLSQKEALTPEDLKDIPLIISKRNMVQNEIANWFGIHYDKLNIVSTYNLIYNAMVMAKEGIGSVVCFDRLVHLDEHSPLCFKPLLPRLETGTVIVWKKHQIFSSAASAFIDELKETFHHR